MNAIDAVGGLPEPRRNVRIAAEPLGDGLAIRVTDSGPGIPDSELERVFEPFFTTKPVGLGMGLSITRSLVEAHGGSIGASRAPGGGAEFEVLLPATRRSANGAGAVG
jgi:signal transduction histidine kinase